MKKKNKFVNLYAKEGRDKLAILLPGRQPCDCLAQKHKLINNCLSCGRIVCEQEGSGPCLFCGSLVSLISVASKMNKSQPIIFYSLHHLLIPPACQRVVLHPCVQKAQMIKISRSYFITNQKKNILYIARGYLRR